MWTFFEIRGYHRVNEHRRLSLIPSVMCAFSTHSVCNEGKGRFARDLLYENSGITAISLFSIAKLRMDGYLRIHFIKTSQVLLPSSKPLCIYMFS